MTPPRPRIAVIQHEVGCPLGLFDGWVRATAGEVTIVRPYAGQSLPAIDETDGLVVLGGSMSATDDQRYPWLTDTNVLLRRAVDHGLPTLGICLGHQLLTVACGGHVAPNPAGKQMGVVPVGFTAVATTERLFASVAGSPAVSAIQWNSDISVEIPPNATVLATTAAGVPQAMRVGAAAWGVQFHPEADAEIVTGWAEADGPMTPAAREAIAGIAAAAPTLASTWRPLADRFVAIAAERDSCVGRVTSQ